MKNCILIFITAVLLFSAACKKKYEIIELPRIEYDVLLNNYGNNYSWFDHMDGFSRLEMFSVLISNAKSGNFRIEDMNGQQITNSDLDGVFELKFLIDSSETMILLNAENLNGIRFRESWKVNSGTGEIQKEVYAFCPLFFKKHPYQDGSLTQDVYPLFWIYPSENNVSTKDELVIKRIAFDVIIDNTLEMITTSYGDQLPFYFYNIETSLKSGIVSAILEGGLKKSAVIYDYFFNEMKEEDVKLLQERYGNKEISDDQGDGGNVFSLDKSRIQRLKFIEEWTLDKNTLQFFKKVIAVSPSELSFDDYGEFKGFKFLFWLLFDKSKKSELVFE